jgi:hypothetical protein
LAEIKFPLLQVGSRGELFTKGIKPHQARLQFSHLTRQRRYLCFGSFTLLFNFRFTCRKNIHPSFGVSIKEAIALVRYQPAITPSANKGGNPQQTYGQERTSPPTQGKTASLRMIFVDDNNLHSEIYFFIG